MADVLNIPPYDSPCWQHKQPPRYADNEFGKRIEEASPSIYKLDTRRHSTHPDAPFSGGARRNCGTLRLVKG